MAQTLGILPQGVPLVDEAQAASDFFRLRWEELIKAVTVAATRAATSFTAQSAALPTTSVYIPPADGYYRLSFYLRKTSADGVSSSATVTLGWTESGIPLTLTFPALTLDSTLAVQSDSIVVVAEAFADLTIAVAYASGTPGSMEYRIDAVVESLA